MFIEKNCIIANDLINKCYSAIVRWNISKYADNYDIKEKKNLISHILPKKIIYKVKKWNYSNNTIKQ